MPKSGSRAKKTESTPVGTAPRRSRKDLQGDAQQVQAAPTASPMVELAADLRIGAAAATHAAILAASANEELVLDGARVAKIDAAGIQALLSALIQISRSGGRWRWHNPSTTLIQGVAVLGLRDSLQLP